MCAHTTQTLVEIYNSVKASDFAYRMSEKFIPNFSTVALYAREKRGRKEEGAEGKNSYHTEGPIF